VPYHDGDFYAAQVMSTALGGGMSSRLFQEVREKRGLCYSVFSFATSYVDGGMLGIYAGTGEREVGELVPVVLDETRRLAADAGETEVARARAQIRAGLLMALESPSARSEQLARQLLIFGRPIPPEELVTKIDLVDAAAVRRVLTRITGAGRPAVAALGPLAQLASYDVIAARFV
jgi:predicted Zn-dependent peptidase